MFKHIPITHHGDQQPQGCAAAQQHPLTALLRRGDFAAGDCHV